MNEPTFERATNKALGQLLVDRGFITREQCEQALAYAKTRGIRVGQALVELGYVTHDLLSAALGEQFGMRPLVIDPTMIDRDLIARFPLDLLRRHHLLPLLDLGEELIVAAADPNDSEGLRMLARLVPDRRLVVQLADAVEVDKCLALVAAQQPEMPASEDSLESMVESDGLSLADALRARLEAGPERELLLRLAGGRLIVQGRAEPPHAGEPATGERPSPAPRAQFWHAFVSAVQWLPGLFGRVGWLRSSTSPSPSSDSAYPVLVLPDLHGVAIRIRRLDPYRAAATEAEPPNLESLDGRLVILVVEHEPAWAHAIASWSVASSKPLFVGTESSPWLFSAAIQWPIVGPESMVAIRRLGVSTAIFDALLPAEVVWEIFAAAPNLERIVLACPASRWHSGLRQPYEPIIANWGGCLARIAPSQWHLEQLLPAPDPTARR